MPISEVSLAKSSVLLLPTMVTRRGRLVMPSLVESAQWTAREADLGQIPCPCWAGSPCSRRRAHVRQIVIDLAAIADCPGLAVVDEADGVDRRAAKGRVQQRLPLRQIAAGSLGIDAVFAGDKRQGVANWPYSPDATP